MRAITAPSLALALALAACTGPQNAPPNSAPPASSYAPAATLLPAPFNCPARGTTTQVENYAQIMTITYQGSVGPATCQYTANGVTTSSLYTQYPTATVTQGLDAIAAGFAQLFAGQATSFSAEYVISTVGFSTLKFKDTWTVLGVDTLQVGGQPIRALVFQRVQEGERGSAFRGTERQWWDPVSGLWLKRQVINTDGWSWGPDWRVTSFQRGF